MNHALLKSVIYDQHEFIRNFQIVPRDYEFEENGNYVLVGLRRAGKSTLLNYLTGADIPANDRLFDTLDTTTRSLTLPDGQEILLTDTVGFINKLPHHLIDAFRSTLEEARYADYIRCGYVKSADGAADAGRVRYAAGTES